MYLFHANTLVNFLQIFIVRNVFRVKILEKGKMFRNAGQSFISVLWDKKSWLKGTSDQEHHHDLADLDCDTRLLIIDYCLLWLTVEENSKLFQRRMNFSFLLLMCTENSNHYNYTKGKNIYQCWDTSLLKKILTFNFFLKDIASIFS